MVKLKICFYFLSQTWLKQRASIFHLQDFQKLKTCVIYSIGNKNIYEITVENVEPELINLHNISWFTLLSWKVS